MEGAGWVETLALVGWEACKEEELAGEGERVVELVEVLLEQLLVACR